MKTAFKIIYKILIVSVLIFAALSLLGIPMVMLFFAKILPLIVLQVYGFMIGYFCLIIYLAIIILFFIDMVVEDKWKLDC